MDVVVTGRHCELSDRFRSHVEEKLARLEKHDHRIIRVQVEVEKERNPRQHDRAVRVELTAFSKGPVIRAEAAAEDKMARPRPRARQDGRADAPGRRPPPGAPRPAHPGLGRRGARRRDRRPRRAPTTTSVVTERQVGPITVTGDGPLVVREKTHPASPMTLDQALYEMELVGHDFYLFVDKESERPSVVYRRTRLRLRRHLARRELSPCTPARLVGWPDRAIGPRAPVRAPTAHGTAQSCHDAAWLTRDTPSRSPSGSSSSTTRSCSAAG